MIRGKSVDDSKAILSTLARRAGMYVEEVLDSAIANATSDPDIEPRDLYISRITVDGGPMFKRIQPHARGMGFLIKKRFSHITVAVEAPEAIGSTGADDEA